MVLGCVNPDYDVSGRLAQVETDADGDDTYETTTLYAYDDRGLRVSETTNGVTTTYLFDVQNPTGYAQVLEEYVNNVLQRSYTLGMDVLAQTRHDAAARDFLLYDGHGNTRALLTAALAFTQKFAYDAYGVMLSSAQLATAATALTRLLYSGEWTRRDGTQYLRARDYNPATGRFTSLDPFAGNPSDPLSLHKYLYANGNSIVGIDPSGMSALLFGTAVHQYLCRSQFELSGGAFPISTRYGNRWVSTIIWYETRTWIGPVPFRPDMVEVYNTPLGKRGDIYELKPGPITLLTNPNSAAGVVPNAVNQLTSYLVLLYAAPSISWDYGMSLWPNVKTWPGFTGAPIGTQLVTYADYSLLRGIILYDILPTRRALQIAGLTIAAAAAIAATWAAAPIVGGAATTVGTAITAGIADIELMLDLILIREIGTGTPGL